MANSRHALEVLIEDIDGENTWRKSMRTFNFLETTNEDANFSIYFMGEGYWDIVKDNVNESWSEYISDHKLILKQLEFGALQFTNVDDKYYTNFSVHHPGELLKKQKPKSLTSLKETRFDQSLISKPFAVRNHNNHSLEMIVQDSSYTLNLVLADQTKGLKIPLKEPLVTPVYQIDYYINGKFQYLFALKHSVHIVDRTGTYIPGYPVKIGSDQPVKYINLIDYDGKKDYRIMVATEKSYYFLLDKAGRKLKGWNPKKLTGAPMMPGQHLRVGKNDFMLFLQGNGIVHVLNRKGIGRNGFPIDLKNNISSPLNIRKGGSLSTTELVAMTDVGELVEFNLQGRVQRRKQFYKESLDEKFALVNSNNSENYIISKLSNDLITFYSGNEELLFSVQNFSNNPEIQYYNFGSGNDVMVIADRKNKSTTLYNMEGVALHNIPINSGFKVGLLYHDQRKMYEIYYSSDNSLIQATLKN
jgi:hypothetical protein